MLAVHDVVQFDIPGRAASRHAAAAAITAQHETTRCRWDVLRRTLGARRVERTDALCVAVRTGERRVIDRNATAGRLLPGAPAIRARGDRDLERRTAAIAGACRACGVTERCDEIAIVQPLAAFVVELLAHLAQQRQCV